MKSAMRTNSFGQRPCLIIGDDGRIDLFKQHFIRKCNSALLPDDPKCLSFPGAPDLDYQSH